MKKVLSILLALLSVALFAQGPGSGTTIGVGNVTVNINAQDSTWGIEDTIFAQSFEGRMDTVLVHTWYYCYDNMTTGFPRLPANHTTTTSNQAWQSVTFESTRYLKDLAVYARVERANLQGVFIALHEGSIGNVIQTSQVLSFGLLDSGVNIDKYVFDDPVFFKGGVTYYLQLVTTVPGKNLYWKYNGNSSSLDFGAASNGTDLEMKICFSEFTFPVGKDSTWAVADTVFSRAFDGRLDTAIVSSSEGNHTIFNQTIRLGEGAMENSFPVQNPPYRMTVIGTNAARNMEHSTGTVVIGAEALENLSTTPVTEGVAIGYQAGKDISYAFGASNFTLLGHMAGKEGDVRSSVVIGSNAKETGGMIQSVIIGDDAAFSVSGITDGGATNSWRNVIIGAQAGFNLSATNKSVIIGQRAGFNPSAATIVRSVLIGDEVGSNQANITDQLWIDNSSTSTPLIQGNFATDQLTINGSLTSSGSIVALSTSSSQQFNSALGGNILINDKVNINSDLVMNGAMQATNDIEITDNTKGLILRSPNGTKYRLVVDNAGVLSTVVVP